MSKAKKFDNIFVVIPAKDEEKYVNQLFDKLLELGLRKIVLVNDCSKDKTKQYAELRPEVTVLDHIINLGPGAATQTGIAYALSKNAEIIATIDADLQHNPADIIRLVNHMYEHDCELVIGSRFIQNNDIPLSRRIYNKIANIVSYFLTGLYLTDSQSGLKVIRSSLASSLNLNYDGFEFCMEIIKQAKVEKAKISEIPIDVIYTPETTKKGQNLQSGIRIVARLLSPFS